MKMEIKIETDLTWDIIIDNPLFAQATPFEPFLSVEDLKKASEPLQKQLMASYDLYLYSCLQLKGKDLLSDFEYQETLNSIKRYRELIYQEVYGIKPIRPTQIVDIKVSENVITKFNVTQVIHQPIYVFSKLWGYNSEYLTKSSEVNSEHKIISLQGLFEGKLEIDLNSELIFKVDNLFGHKGYLYKESNSQDWILVATEKVIW
jgi:hypothetical protein